MHTHIRAHAHAHAHALCLPLALKKNPRFSLLCRENQGLHPVHFVPGLTPPLPRRQASRLAVSASAGSHVVTSRKGGTTSSVGTGRSSGFRIRRLRTSENYPGQTRSTTPYPLLSTRCSLLSALRSLLLALCSLLSPASYSLRLPAPVLRGSGIVQISYPVTAAGPLQFLTGFPIIPADGTCTDRRYTIFYEVLCQLSSKSVLVISVPFAQRLFGFRFTLEFHML